MEVIARQFCRIQHALLHRNTGPVPPLCLCSQATWSGGQVVMFLSFSASLERTQTLNLTVWLSLQANITDVFISACANSYLKMNRSAILLSSALHNIVTNSELHVEVRGWKRKLLLASYTPLAEISFTDMLAVLTIFLQSPLISISTPIIYVGGSLHVKCLVNWVLKYCDCKSQDHQTAPTSLLCKTP